MSREGALPTYCYGGLMKKQDRIHHDYWLRIKTFKRKISD